MSKPVNPIPEGYPTVSPYLIVEDPVRILTFLEEAFGGTVLQRHLSPEGQVIHAEVRIGDSVVMLGGSNDEWPPLKSMTHLYMPDVDDVFRRAVEAGAQPVREPETMPYGDRTGGVEDPGGNQWWIATRVEVVDADELARRYSDNDET